MVEVDLDRIDVFCWGCELEWIFVDWVFCGLVNFCIIIVFGYDCCNVQFSYLSIVDFDFDLSSRLKYESEIGIQECVVLLIVSFVFRFFEVI